MGTALRGGAALVVIERGMPDDLAGTRVLDVVAGSAGETPEDPLTERGAAGVTTADPSALPDGSGEFGLVLCRDALRATPHPMALLTDLWRLAAPGAILLLETEVLPDSENSQYARFAANASHAGWTPGRLALRWMVETAGFDVERWLEDPGASDGSPRACLRAVRTEREPASSTP